MTTTNDKTAGEREALPAFPPLSYFLENSTHDMQRDAIRGYAREYARLALASKEPAGAVADADTTTREQYRRMFNAACEALGSINEALKLDPDDGGAEPILEAIQELQGQNAALTSAARETLARAEDGDSPTYLQSHEVAALKEALAAPGAAIDAREQTEVDSLRAEGWAVAVHNDYKLQGVPYTFWLFTKGDRAVKGEGQSDAEALAQVRAALSSRDEPPAVDAGETEAGFAYKVKVWSAEIERLIGIADKHAPGQGALDTALNMLDYMKRQAAAHASRPEAPAESASPATVAQQVGWQPVPVEPTPAMLHAMWQDRESFRGQSENKTARHHYALMLKAAPALPLSGMRQGRGSKLRKLSPG